MDKEGKKVRDRVLGIFKIYKFGGREKGEGKRRIIRRSK